MNPLADEELIARCADGDRRAMDMLVSRYHSKLLDFALRHLNDREAAADIAQATLVRVFQNACSYRVKASFKTWLYTIAMNQVRDEYRRRARRTESVSVTAEQYEATIERLPSETEESQSLEDQVLMQFETAAIWNAVANLSDNHKSAIILRYRQDLKYEEIAEVMDVPCGTVRSWVHHALRALRRSLEPMKSED